MLEYLPRVIAAVEGKPELANEDHPMRQVTRQVAFEPGGWTRERCAKVAELFDRLAPEWHTRFTENRAEPLMDALDRGRVGGRVCVEVGSGIGFSSPLLAARFPILLAVDLSREMLLRAPADAGLRVQADSACLPVRDGQADVLVLENALLFPREMARALAPTGALVWVNSLGASTPIHLSADDVLRAMPGEWTGIASDAGWGTWCVARRTITG